MPKRSSRTSTASAIWSRNPLSPTRRPRHHRPLHLTPDIFDAIERTKPGAGGEIQITDAMRLLLKDRPFYAVKLDGIRHDAGDKLGFLIATVEFALKRADLGEDFRAYLKSLKL